jgi:hypothetical protein
MRRRAPPGSLLLELSSVKIGCPAAQRPVPDQDLDTWPDPSVDRNCPEIRTHLVEGENRNHRNQQLRMAGGNSQQLEPN